MPHEHEYTIVARRSGRKVRRQCTCLRLTQWVLEFPEGNPLNLETMTITELRKLAKEKVIRRYTVMTKQELIEALTEVRVGR